MTMSTNIIDINKMKYNLFQDDSEIKLYIGLDLLHKAELFMKKTVQPPFETTS